MRVTLDTNVFGPVSSPDEYPNEQQTTEIVGLREAISSNKITAFISEASLKMEALAHANRIDVYIRAIANRNISEVDVKLAEQRINVIENTLNLGVKVLHAPRIGYGSFYEIKTEYWAEDELFTIGDRQDRYFGFGRAYDHKGPKDLKDLGTELAELHDLKSDHLNELVKIPGMPKASEMMWSQGLVAEFDSPKKFTSNKKFTKHVREIIAEWSDMDILASHYGYGNNIFCTLDKSKETGIEGILHSNKREELKNNFGIEIQTPQEIIEKINKT